jgi:hypothetical protein
MDNSAANLSSSRFGFLRSASNGLGRQSRRLLRQRSGSCKTETHKNLHSAAHTKWEHRGGQLVEAYYAPVYIQHTHQKSTGDYLEVKAACNK